MKEFVFYIFVRDGKLLLEHRLQGSEEPGMVFLPCGGIEAKDHESEEDYRVVAMNREIREELGGTITVTDFSYLTTVEKAETISLYHSYLIREWNGELPEYSLEAGHKNARLAWAKLDEAFLTIDSEVARMTIGKAISVLREEETARSYASLNES